MSRLLYLLSHLEFTSPILTSQNHFVLAQIIQLDWESPKNIDRIYILGYNIYYKRESDTQEEMLFIEGNRNKQFLIGMSMALDYFLEYLNTLLNALVRSHFLLLKVFINTTHNAH